MNARKTEIAMARKAISKKLRFEVFNRDGFRCQYCGRAAPDVVLNADHMEAVISGGETTIFNLITACFDCNSGKSDRPISRVVVAEKLNRPWLLDFDKTIELLRWKECGYIQQKKVQLLRRRFEQAINEGVTTEDMLAVADYSLSVNDFLCGLICLVMDAREAKKLWPMFFPVK